MGRIEGAPTVKRPVWENPNTRLRCLGCTKYLVSPQTSSISSEALPPAGGSKELDRLRYSTGWIIHLHQFFFLVEVVFGISRHVQLVPLSKRVWGPTFKITKREHLRLRALLNRAARSR